MAVKEFRDEIRVTRLDPLTTKAIRIPTTVFELEKLELGDDNTLRYNKVDGDYEVWLKGKWISITGLLESETVEPIVTGLMSGGELTRKDDTHISVAAGEGRYANSWTDPKNVSVTDITWPDGDMSIPVQASIGAVAIGVTQAGLLTTLPIPVQPSTWRDNVILGIVYWSASAITEVVEAPHVIRQTGVTLFDYLTYIGATTKRKQLHIKGVDRHLQLWRDKGEFFQPGLNWNTERKNLNIKGYAADGSDTVAANFKLIKKDGVSVGDITDVPKAWENAGVVEGLTGTEATIHYIYMTYGSDLIIQYGQNKYADGDEARTSLAQDAETFVPFPASVEVMLLAQVWVSHNSTDFSGTDEGINNNVGIDAGGSGALGNKFIDLNDTPATYTGQKGKSVRVKEDESGLEFTGAADDAARVSEKITQAGHGFLIGEFIYEDDAGVWQKAKSDVVRTLKIGMVTNPTATTFSILHYGVYHYAAPHTFTIGATYYLSDVTEGQPQLAKPVGKTYVQACFEVLDDTDIKVIDQAVVDNAVPRAPALIGVIIPDYTPTFDYRIDDMFMYRKVLYQVAIQDMGMGSSSSYRQTVHKAATNDKWVKICEIDPGSAGNIYLSGNDSVYTMEISASLSGIIAMLTYSQSGDVQIDELQIRHSAIAAPYELWLHLNKFDSDWIADFRWNGVGRTEVCVHFDDPIVPQVAEPIGTLVYHIVGLPEGGSGVDTGGTLIPDWDVTKRYVFINEVVTKDKVLYRCIYIVNNLAKDPALLANSGYWKAITSSGYTIFAQPEPPTTTGTVIVNEGDVWIDTNAPPSGDKAGTTYITYFRHNDEWRSNQGNVRVVRDADGWATLGRGTELVLLDKKIDNTGYSSGSAAIAFVDSGNSWVQAKLWNHPWGYITNVYHAGNVAVNTSAWTPLAEVVPTFQQGRKYKIDWGCTWKLRGSDSANLGSATLQINHGNVMWSAAYWEGVALSVNSLTGSSGGTYIHGHTSAAGAVRFTVVGQDRHNDAEAGSRFIVVTDIGPN